MLFVRAVHMKARRPTMSLRMSDTEQKKPLAASCQGVEP